MSTVLTRRDWLSRAANVCAALPFMPRLLAAQPTPVITRPIPSSGERLPIIGLGSSATFSETAAEADLEAIRAVLQTMVSNGGTVFDTAPGYGASEEVAGRVVNELGIRDRVFWATKLNVAGLLSLLGFSADRDEAHAQVETSLRRYGNEPIDLIQVHNLGDMETQFSVLREFKAAGRIRYIGATTTFGWHYDNIERFMQDLPLDFIGIDYAVDNLRAEERLLPLARDLGIAVMVYMPFGRTRLWERVAGQALPDWAAEFDAHTWAQFFLKFVASHPAVTVVTPATSRPEHMLDNMGAAMGRLPDASERRRMIQLIEQLPG